MFICSFCSCKGQNENAIIFEEVWSNVNDDFFDPNFDTVNWLVIKKEYEPLIQNCNNNEDLFLTLNKMIFELNSSHCGVGLLSELESNVSPYIFKKGEIGLDIRIIENQIIVTNVLKNSSADNANIKLGYKIQNIDGLTLEDINQLVNYKPPFNKRNKRFHLTSEVLRKIYGEPKTKVKITFLDKYNFLTTVILTRTKRNSKINIGEGLPDAFVQSKSYFISKDIAYLSFNAFQPNNLDHVLSNLDKVYKSKGLIIDLRGNDGGSIEGMKLLLGRFISERKKYGTYINRNERNDDFIEPITPKYLGKLVLLVDEMSISAAENTAGIIKQFNLGKVIGNQTPGQMLWGNGYLINDSIALAIPIYKLEYPNGFNPENNGIHPDFKIGLNRKDLLNGIDSQLSFAINYLNNLITKQ